MSRSEFIFTFSLELKCANAGTIAVPETFFIHRIVIFNRSIELFHAWCLVSVKIEINRVFFGNIICQFACISCTMYMHIAHNNCWQFPFYFVAYSPRLRTQTWSSLRRDFPQCPDIAPDNAPEQRRAFTASDVFFFGTHSSAPSFIEYGLHLHIRHRLRPTILYKKPTRYLFFESQHWFIQ